MIELILIHRIENPPKKKEIVHFNEKKRKKLLNYFNQKIFLLNTICGFI